MGEKNPLILGSAIRYWTAICDHEYLIRNQTYKLMTSINYENDSQYCPLKHAKNHRVLVIVLGREVWTGSYFLVRFESDEKASLEYLKRPKLVEIVGDQRFLTRRRKRIGV